MLIRLAAALMVMETHSHILAGKEKDPYFQQHFHFSFLGLPSFFFLSGLLVTQSLYTSSSWKNFLWKRFLRLYPAACLSILAAALIMGPCVTAFGIKDYFSSPLLYQYLQTCSLIRIHFLLPGVFNHSALGTDSINSSLWTISMEIKLYIGLLAAWLVKIPGKRKILLALIATLIAISCFLTKYGIENINGMEWMEWIYPKLLPYLTYGVLFLAGVLCNLYKDRIIIRGYWIILLPLTFIASFWLGIFFFTSYILIPALVIFAAIHGSAYLKKITPKADLSYGIYVFAFPVQQLVANYLHPAGPFRLFLYSVAAVLPLAILSWYGVEKRSMALKQRIP